MLRSEYVLVGHNMAFDMAVIAAQWPNLLPLIFAKYRRGQVTDTLIREQLIMIARGQFRSYAKRLPDGDVEMVGVKYALADCIQRHFGRQLKKEGFRLFYRAFDQTPDIKDWPDTAVRLQDSVRRGDPPEWFQAYYQAGLIDDEDIAGLLAADPSEAVAYALEDATTALALYEDQARVAPPEVFRDEYRQAYAAFCLHLASCWGLYTDPEAVDRLETALTAEFEDLRHELQGWGLIRENGVADTKAAAEMMVAACAEEELPVPRTKKGAVSLGAEGTDRFFDAKGTPLPDLGPSAEVVAKYAQYLTLRKTLSNDIKMLRSGCENPIQPRYDLADTGRARCAKPNIQAINKGAGIREAFRPRPGTAFIQADYPSLELHTLAVWCLERIGHSAMAESLNAGRDLHVEVGGRLLGLDYATALARYEAGDPEMKKARQAAKAVNYGLPGGLGEQKLIRYAKASYRVDMTLAEARQTKQVWLQTYPEMVEFFRLAAAATNNPAGEGTEEHVFVGRIRGGARYSALCNGRFQGLGADAAKAALCLVTEACYVDRMSPLYGCRVVAFIHDELILECPLDRVDPAARELARLMAVGANDLLARCPMTLTPMAMRKWSKDAQQILDADGRIIPWDSDETG